MPLIATATLEEIMHAALRRRGLAARHRRFVVDGLLFASRRGIDTHGVRLFPTYLAELDGGRSRARPRLRWARRRGATRLLDAGHALGLVAGRVATDAAVQLAAAHGVGAVAVASSNHFGAASYYTVEMARHGTIGLAFSNADALVAPHGGHRPALGTNPLSLAAYGSGGDLFCLDMATSQVSYSQVMHRQRQGLPLEHGWAIAAGGAVEALKPLGGYKGQGLAMAVEVLCSLLAGMPLGHQLSHLYSPPFDEPRRVSHLLVALDVAAFTDRAAFQARLSAWLAALRQVEATGPAAAVLAPGDLEAAAAGRRACELPLADEEWRAMEIIAREAGT